MKKLIIFPLLIVFIFPQISFSKNKKPFYLLRLQLESDIVKLDEIGEEIVVIINSKYKQITQERESAIDVLKQVECSRNDLNLFRYILEIDYTIKENYINVFYTHIYESVKESIDSSNHALRQIHPKITNQTLLYLIDKHINQTSGMLKKYDPKIIL